MLSALAFLTVVGGAHPPGRTTLRWFPVVGVVIGGILASVWLTADAVWGPAIAAALVISADLLITGMLHFDGLADSADGLLPHLDRDRRLVVMAAPDVGAFAVTVVPSVLLLRWVALAGDTVEPLALVGVWAASRTVMAVVPALVSYARPDGMAAPFLAGARRSTALWMLPVAGLLIVVEGFGSLAALSTALVAAALVVGLARRRVGGFTGDVLGATAVVAETVLLLGLAA